MLVLLMMMVLLLVMVVLVSPVQLSPERCLLLVRSGLTVSCARCTAGNALSFSTVCPTGQHHS